MSTLSPYVAETCYQLHEEIRSHWKTQSLTDEDKPRMQSLDLRMLSITTQGLHYAIIFYHRALINFAVFSSPKVEGQPNHALSQTHGRRNFTAIHIAVISDNLFALQILLEANALPNSKDIYGWTPLHHAAFLGNKSMMQLLLVHRADPHSRTNKGATPENIWNIVHGLSVCPSDTIRLIWQVGDKKEMLTQKKFKALADATYLEENRMAQNLYWNEYSMPYDSLKQLLFAKEYAKKYQEFIASPPLHILKQVSCDSSGRPLNNLGFGLFAKKRYQPGEIIGEYLGEICHSPQENAYLFHYRGKTIIDSLKEKNDMAFINDGFNNVVPISIYNTAGLAIRKIFIAAETIESEEQFCWNYGSCRSKLVAYTELRAKEVREFILVENFDELFQLYTNEKEVLDFEEFVRKQKFHYILETKAVLFLLIFEGRFSDIELEKIGYLKFSIEGKDSLKLIDLAEECQKLHKKLKNLFPEFANTYETYMRNTIEKGGIVQLEILIPFINPLLSENITFQKIQETQLITFWHGVILPNCEKIIREFNRIYEEKRKTVV